MKCSIPLSIKSMKSYLRVPNGSQNGQNLNPKNDRASNDDKSLDKNLIASSEYLHESEDHSETNSILLDSKMKEENLAYFMAGIFVEPFYHNFDDLHTLGPDWWVFKSSKPTLLRDWKVMNYSAPHSKHKELSDDIDSQAHNQKELPLKLKAHNPSNRIGCRCKMSKCLRLHCRCFKDMEYCLKNCKCLGCFNTQAHEKVRRFVIQKTSEILPTAFKPKVVSFNQFKPTSLNVVGCVCKSGCSRNYCECFKNQAKCSPLCKCTGCQNNRSDLDSKVLEAVPKHVRSKNKLVISSVGSHLSNKLSADTEAGLSRNNPNLSSRNRVEELDLRSKNNSRSTELTLQRTNTVVSFENYKRVKLETLKF